MIKVLKKDNLYDIIYKIEKENIIEKTIVLEVPFWHQFLYNYLSLKIITNKYKNKRIIIITADIASKQIWKQFWIKYTLVKNNNYLEGKKDILRYNYSFVWYLNYEIKKYISKIKKFITWTKQVKNVKKYYIKHSKEKISVFLLLSMFTISLFIFLYIFYFSINKTNIYITPNINVISKSKNFNFIYTNTPEKLKKYEERLIKIEKEVEIESIYNTTDLYQDEDNRSSWYVEIFNTLKDELKLRPKTRFLSWSWIIYENKDWINIPKANYNSNWELVPTITKVKLYWRLKDEKWNFIWSKWNTWTWVKLTIPWLNDIENNIYFEDYIYAKTSTIFEWWKDDYKYKVWINDKENSKIKILKELENKAIEVINKEIENLNKINWVTYQLLEIPNIYKYPDIKIDNLDNIIVWNDLEKFNIKWKLKVRAYVFNKESVINKLKDEINWLVVWENEKILNIRNEVRIPYVLERNNDDTKIKATVSVLIEMQYNFKDTSDSYVQRLKTTIAWMNKEEATNILINESNISNAKIETRPYFIKNVSPIYSSIEFIIE